MPALIGRRISTMCSSLMRRARGCWPRRSRMTRRGCGRCAGSCVRLGVALVAVERPDGLLVERLLDAGLRVLALHPNQVAAARDRFRVSGGKSDRFDAFVLCELARTDHHRFRVLEPDSDADQGAASVDPRAGGPGRDARPRWATSCAPSSSGSGPARWGCSAICTVRSHWRSLSATRARPTRVGWARRAWPDSWRASATPAASRPRSCWPSSRPRRKVASASRSWPPAGSWY